MKLTTNRVCYSFFWSLLVLGWLVSRDWWDTKDMHKVKLEKFGVLSKIDSEIWQFTDLITSKWLIDIFFSFSLSASQNAFNRLCCWKFSEQLHTFLNGMLFFFFFLKLQKGETRKSTSSDDGSFFSSFQRCALLPTAMTRDIIK
jgi:hypothetical protein